MIPGFDGGRFALFFDIDGTLIDIAPRPHEVVVPPDLVASLRAVSDVLDGALALISGRTIADIDMLFRPLRLPVSGVHGAEVRFDPQGGIRTPSDGLLPPGIVGETQALAAHVPGSIVEDKRFSVAIHYRQNPAAGPALHQALRDLVEAREGDDLRILPGHMVFEIKRATFDKGLAIGRFMDVAPFLGRRPVFLGDDVTDRPGFDVVLKGGGYAFSVGRSFPGLSGSFPTPAAVRHWLAELAASETSHA